MSYLSVLSRAIRSYAFSQRAVAVLRCVTIAGSNQKRNAGAHRSAGKPGRVSGGRCRAAARRRTIKNPPLPPLRQKFIGICQNSSPWERMTEKYKRCRPLLFAGSAALFFAVVSFLAAVSFFAAALFVVFFAGAFFAALIFVSPVAAASSAAFFLTAIAATPLFYKLPFTPYRPAEGI